jgi:hypothetical protein
MGHVVLATRERIRRREFEEMIVLRFDAQGRVVHQRGVVDNLSALRQAGVLPG